MWKPKCVHSTYSIWIWNYSPIIIHSEHSEVVLMVYNYYYYYELFQRNKLYSVYSVSQLPKIYQINIWFPEKRQHYVKRVFGLIINISYLNYLKKSRFSVRMTSENEWLFQDTKLLKIIFTIVFFSFLINWKKSFNQKYCCKNVFW